MEEIKMNYIVGQTVYLATDPDQNERLITGIRIQIRPNYISIVYNLSCGPFDSDHFEIELTDVRDVVKITS